MSLHHHQQNPNGNARFAHRTSIQHLSYFIDQIFSTLYAINKNLPQCKEPYAEIYIQQANWSTEQKHLK